MGLMDFLSKAEVQSFAKGYLKSEVAKMQAFADAEAKAKELEDTLAAETAQTLGQRVAEREQDALFEEEDNREHYELLEKMYSDMNPIVFQYLKSQGYLTNGKEISDSFFKPWEEKTNSKKWYTFKIPGTDKQWDNTFAEQLSKTYNVESTIKDTEVNANLTPNANKIQYEGMDGKAVFDFLSPSILSPEDILSYRKGMAELTVAESEAKLAAWDAENINLVKQLPVDLQEQQKKMNELSIQMKEYDIKTKPQKDLIDMSLTQADLLSKQINNSTLRQKNMLTINELQTNIDRVRQTMSITEAEKDLNFQKLQLTVDNLRLDNTMQEEMNKAQPLINGLRIHGMMLDNISKNIDNKTASEIDQLTVDNMKARNTILEKDLQYYDEDKKIEFETQKKKIEELDAKLKERPKLTMLSPALINNEADKVLGQAVGAPSTSGIEGMVYQFQQMKQPWINSTITDAKNKISATYSQYQNSILNDPNSNIYGLDPDVIDFNNIAMRHISSNVRKAYENDADMVNQRLLQKYNDENVVLLNESDKKILYELGEALLIGKQEIEGKDISREKAKEILTEKFNIKTFDVFTEMTAANELASTSISPWTPALYQLALDSYENKYKIQNDIREQ